MDLHRLLAQRANGLPEHIGYRFLTGADEELSLSYGKLAGNAWLLAEKIRRKILPGQRVLLVYPAGLSFIEALYACFIAKVVAVPLPVPALNDSLGRLDYVIKDCDPAAVFTDSATLPHIRRHLADVFQRLIVCTDEGFDLIEKGVTSSVAAPDVAVLQYTSGSTSKPLGVVLTHANLLANLKQIAVAFGHTRESSGVIWLPHYHDMGLIGGILQPLYAGFPVTLMSPTSFIQRPLRWLQAIDRYRGTTSGGPNFAYELCVPKAEAAQELGLDLSSWIVAFNGAEPIKAGTLDAFAKAFSSIGFKRSAFTPCYGLAEATLLVTAAPVDEEPRVINPTDLGISSSQLTATERNSLVSCGVVAKETAINVVQIDNNAQCQDGDIGEILVEGPSVASSYWGKSNSIFRKNHGNHQIRTGDLGFQWQGQLFITGRLKDLIVIRGKNLFPEDIECLTGIAEPKLSSESAVAFGVRDNDGSERLIVMQEMRSRTARSLNLEATKEAVTHLIFQRHGIQLANLVFVKAGGLIRTSSGKLSRFACREMYVSGDFVEVESRIVFSRGL